MADTLRPCDRITYVHYCLGGPHDGARTPSEHCYEALEIDGDNYVRIGDAVQMDEGPPGLEVLNCTDDFFEPVFFRVDMVFSENPNG